MYPFSLSCPRLPPLTDSPLLSFYLPCTQSSLLTERKWKPPTFQDEVALHQDVKVQRKRPKGPRGQHTPRSQVYSRQYQGLGSGLEKSWCFEYVQVQFRLLIPQPLLEWGYPVLVVNGRGPGPWGSAEGTFIISLTANVMWGFMEVLRDPIKKNSSESKPAQSGFSRGNSPLCWYVCVCH